MKAGQEPRSTNPPLYLDWNVFSLIPAKLIIVAGAAVSLTAWLPGGREREPGKYPPKIT